MEEDDVISTQEIFDELDENEIESEVEEEVQGE